MYAPRMRITKVEGVERDPLDYLLIDHHEVLPVDDNEVQLIFARCPPEDLRVVNGDTRPLVPRRHR